MSKILFVSAFTPSSSSAGQNFTLQLLGDLSKNHTIDLVFFKTGSDVFKSKDPSLRVVEEVPLSPALKLIHVVLFPFFHPLFSGRFSYRVLMLIRRLIKGGSYDIVYFDFSQVFLYSLFFRRQRKLLMCHDIIYQKYKRSGHILERWWVYLTEKIIFAAPETTLLTFSEKDRAIIRKIYKRPSEVVNFFLSPMIMDLAPEVNVEPNTFCFFGAWNRHENSGGLAWFLKNVLPTLSGDSKFVIIGPHLPEELARAVAQQKNISYVGFVKNPYEIIQRCVALIAPIFQGAGVKVKVIESLACGTPVVGTTIAFEGIPRAVTGGTFVCRTPGDFAKRIGEIPTLPGTRTKLRSWFLENYKPGSLEPFIKHGKPRL